MKIKTLHNRRCEDRIATHFAPEQDNVRRSLFAADAFDATLPRQINRKFLQPAHYRGTAIEIETGQLAKTNLGILKRGRLRIHPKVQAVRVVVLVDENLRTLFR